jgi:ubiquinone/menaquinone biosynthesis C-methylase UbiE
MLCCVSIDYLVRPVDVLCEAARVLRPGAPLVITFLNRCVPTKALYGWLLADDDGRCTIVDAYVRAAGGFKEPVMSRRTPDPETGYRGDPLFAVVAHRRDWPA